MPELSVPVIIVVRFIEVQSNVDVSIYFQRQRETKQEDDIGPFRLLPEPPVVNV